MKSRFPTLGVTWVRGGGTSVVGPIYAPGGLIVCSLILPLSRAVHRSLEVGGQDIGNGENKCAKRGK